MPGLKITIPTTFTDTSLPKLRDDVVMPDAGGALILTEPGHPASSAITLPTVAGTTVFLPNIATAQARALGVGTVDNDLRSEMVFASSFLTGSVGLIERSAKGGIHMVTAQASAGDANRWAKLSNALAVQTYVNANKGHAYYASLWKRATRGLKAGATAQANHSVLGAGSFDGPQFYTRGPAVNVGNTVYPNSGNSAGGNFVGGGAHAYGAVGSHASDAAGTQTDTGPSFQSSGISNNGGTTWTTRDMLRVGNNTGATLGTGPSEIFYRFYFEDLTVSGRTYAQVDALDFAEFTKQVLTAGGRYFGDTFTDPASIP